MGPVHETDYTTTNWDFQWPPTEVFLVFHANNARQICVLIPCSLCRLCHAHRYDSLQEETDTCVIHWGRSNTHKATMVQIKLKSCAACQHKTWPTQTSHIHHHLEPHPFFSVRCGPSKTLMNNGIRQDSKLCKDRNHKGTRSDERHRNSKDQKVEKDARDGGEKPCLDHVRLTLMWLLGLTAGTRGQETNISGCQQFLYKKKKKRQETAHPTQDNWTNRSTALSHCEFIPLSPFWVISQLYCTASDYSRLPARSRNSTHHEKQARSGHTVSGQLRGTGASQHLLSPARKPQIRPLLCWSTPAFSLPATLHFMTSQQTSHAAATVPLPNTTWRAYGRFHGIHTLDFTFSNRIQTSQTLDVLFGKF